MLGCKCADVPGEELSSELIQQGTFHQPQHSSGRIQFHTPAHALDHYTLLALFPTACKPVAWPLSTAAGYGVGRRFSCVTGWGTGCVAACVGFDWGAHGCESHRVWSLVCCAELKASLRAVGYLHFSVWCCCW